MSISARGGVLEFVGLEDLAEATLDGNRKEKMELFSTVPLLIVDDRHYLHRFHFTQPRAAMGIDQPEQTQPLANRFEEIWATGEPGINATVLGL